MERRHRGDSALGRDVFEFVDVDLDEFNFRVLGRQFLEERRDGLARSAPARGEINDDLFRATRVRGVTSSVFARLASVFARRSPPRDAFECIVPDAWSASATPRIDAR